jgi:signal-transduction protein with cAMP-binding, CBS, and nucleotidyltransferase domain
MEYQRPILSDLHVNDVIRDANNKLSKDLSIEETLQLMNRNNDKMILVVDTVDILQGVVYKHKLFEFPEEYRKSVKLESIMIKDPFFAYNSDSLHNALVRLSSNDLQEMPVLSNEDNKVIGIITISDLVNLYDKEVQKITKVINRSNLNTKNNDTNNADQIKNKSAHSEQ